MSKKNENREVVVSKGQLLAAAANVYHNESDYTKARAVLDTLFTEVMILRKEGMKERAKEHRAEVKEALALLRQMKKVEVEA